MIVRYTLITVSKEIRGIMAALRMPIMHSPLRISVMRLA